MSEFTENINGFYPARDEIDAWVEFLHEQADKIECKAEIMNRNGFTHSLGVHHDNEFTYVKFTPEGMDEFYGYWQPAFSTPAPLLFHVPGYGAEMSTHPDLVAQGYNVMHVSPLGYATPDGPNSDKMRDGIWPVLADTAISGGEKGYKQWLINCILAIRWAMSQKEVIRDRISFFGSSQGGGCALLLASLYKGRGVRSVAADLPFLTDFPLSGGRGAYQVAYGAIEIAPDKAAAWNALGYIDTVSHAARLTCPVLLTAGGRDDTCPPDTIEALFKQLPCIKSYSYFNELGHRYSREFIIMASAWFGMYA